MPLASNRRVSVNDEFRRLWKEITSVSVEVLYEHSLRETEENHEKLPS